MSFFYVFSGAPYGSDFLILTKGIIKKVPKRAPFGFRTPDEVIYDMRQQLTECEGYSPAKGLFSARKAIMQYAQLKKLPNGTARSRVRAHLP